MRELLWRYFPAMLELDDDGAAHWFLDLWQRVPTPAKAARVRATTIEHLLRRHRIRRLDADGVLDRLGQPAVATAAGTVDAATAHLQVIGERLRLVNRQKYAASRHRGHGHARALQSAADTLLAIVYTMLTAGALFDPAQPSKVILITHVPQPSILWYKE